MKRPTSDNPDSCPACGSTDRAIVEIRALLGGREVHLRFDGQYAHGETPSEDALVIVTFTCPSQHVWSYEFGDPLDGPPTERSGAAN